MIISHRTEETDFLSMLEWQKSQQNIMLHCNLDYDQKSFWAVPILGKDFKELPFYIQEIGYTVAHKNYYVERSNLPSYMLGFTLSGKMQVEYDGNRYTAYPGVCSWIDCTKRHVFQLSKESDTVKAFFVHFYGNGAQQYYDFFQSYCSCSYIDAGEQSTIPLYFQQLINLYKESRYDDVCGFASSSYLSVLCLEIIKLVLKEKRGNTPEYLFSIKKYIEENFYEKISLESLAQQFYISKSYLIKQFKKYIGISPNDYLIQVRLENAKKSLISTNLSVRQIAEKTGITDVSYFIKIFKKLENITPLEYRRLWKNK